MLAFLAVGTEFRPNIGVYWPGYAASGRERCLVRGVAEDDCAVARTEIAPAEAFHIAVSHGKLKHERCGDPFASILSGGERIVPVLHFRQDIAIGAYIARNLPVAGWQLDRGDGPMLVGIIVARPVCEDGLERSEVAPDRNRLEVFVRGTVENSRKLLAGEDGNGFIERNRGYFAEAPDVRCYVANRLFSRLAYAQSLDGGELRV